MSEPAHPQQPLVVVDDVVRFKRNAAVDYLLDHGGIDLNQLAWQQRTGKIPLEDWRQLMQLIGYSVSGYGDLAWSSEDPVWEAEADALDLQAAAFYQEWTSVRNATSQEPGPHRESDPGVETGRLG